MSMVFLMLHKLWHPRNVSDGPTSANLSCKRYEEATSPWKEHQLSHVSWTTPSYFPGKLRTTRASLHQKDSRFSAHRASFSQQEWMQITCLTTRVNRMATASCCWCDPIDSLNKTEVCSRTGSRPILWNVDLTCNFHLTRKDLAFDLTIRVRGYDCEDLGPSNKLPWNAMDAMKYQTPTPECQAQSGTKTTKSTTSGHVFSNWSTW